MTKVKVFRQDSVYFGFRFGFGQRSNNFGSHTGNIPVLGVSGAVWRPYAYGLNDRK